MNNFINDRQRFEIKINSSIDSSTTQYPVLKGLVTCGYSDDKPVRVTRGISNKGFSKKYSIDDLFDIKKAIDIDLSIKSSLSHPIVFIPKSLKSSHEDFDWINNLNPYDRIVNIGRLPYNWDGYGAQKFNPSHIERCVDIYFTFLRYSFSIKNTYCDIQPFVAPCSDGSVLFEWSGNRFPLRQLELTIPVDKSRFITFFKSSESYEEDGKVKDTMLKPLFDWLFTSPNLK